MSTQTDDSPTANHPDTKAGILARFAQIVVVFVLQAAILFIAAGTLAWVWAWVFLGIYIASMMVNSLFLLRTSPETVAERGRPKEMRNWDKVISSLWGLMQFLVLPLVAGLDLRFGWTQSLSVAWHLAGAMVFAAGLGLFGWAMIVNAYFSTVVRIQSDRGHTVCRTGPYRFVRHPGYVGAILQSGGAPVLLGSLWALIPGLVAAGLMVARTTLEDRTLQAELPGYADYTEEVRFRLVPGLW
jgi:protein-S-isoprenylcysteine O-methyltransferase Ste14